MKKIIQDIMELQKKYSDAPAITGWNALTNVMKILEQSFNDLEKEIQYTATEYSNRYYSSTDIKEPEDHFKAGYEWAINNLSYKIKSNPEQVNLIDNEDKQQRFYDEQLRREHPDGQ